MLVPMMVIRYQNTNHENQQAYQSSYCVEHPAYHKPEQEKTRSKKPVYQTHFNYHDVFR